MLFEGFFLRVFFSFLVFFFFFFHFQFLPPSDFVDSIGASRPGFLFFLVDISVILFSVLKRRFFHLSSLLENYR